MIMQSIRLSKTKFVPCSNTASNDGAVHNSFQIYTHRSYLRRVSLRQYRFQNILFRSFKPMYKFMHTRKDAGSIYNRA